MNRRFFIRVGMCWRVCSKDPKISWILWLTREAFVMYALGRTSKGIPILHKKQYSEDQDWGAWHFHGDIPRQQTCPSGELALSVSFPS